MNYKNTSKRLLYKSVVDFGNKSTYLIYLLITTLYSEFNLEN